ncbi:hypothetical protein DVH24_018563 [Malus domestica]|uniref:Uncharacterized protein n=1 Tax=Malus domestica TaxID=3750 RepID=A0A498HI65_MALDO|nr:hypothetical protein DVH24_018563 [Malus domestica]
MEPISILHQLQSCKFGAHLLSSHIIAMPLALNDEPKGFLTEVNRLNLLTVVELISFNEMESFFLS